MFNEEIKNKLKIVYNEIMDKKEKSIYLYDNLPFILSQFLISYNEDLFAITNIKYIKFIVFDDKQKTYNKYNIEINLSNKNVFKLVVNYDYDHKILINITNVYNEKNVLYFERNVFYDNETELLEKLKNLLNTENFIENIFKKTLYV